MTAKLVFQYVVFPGLLFIAIVGMLMSWLERKISARIQWRKGPPWYQSFADLIKLMGKEVLVPAEANLFTFYFAPLLAFFSVALAGAVVMVSGLYKVGFVGDLIVVAYLLIMPSLALVLGGSASGNPVSAVGASREMNLAFSYELPFVLAIMVPIIKSGGAIKLTELGQVNSMVYASGIIAFVVMVVTLHAKLGFPPFDIAEAETELMGGVILEYSGILLGLFELAKQMLLLVGPAFIVQILWGGLNSWWAILKIGLVFLLLVLIKNTNARLRIDQALKFFWYIIGPLAALSVILALSGW